MKLEDYPPGVQCLLKDAAWHLEQLAILEREFRTWQTAQGKPGEIELFTILDRSLPMIPIATEKPLYPVVLPD